MLDSICFTRLFVSERKQIAIMADEKSPTRISHRLFATSCSEMRVSVSKKLLAVIDMQNDFIDGSLGTPEAEAIVDNVVAKINTYTKDCVYATRDTHQDNYLQTQEGENLPIVHCIEGTYGWQLNEKVQAALGSAVVMNKPSFGSWELADMMVMEFAGLPAEECEIEIIGLCTDICVVSNALILKARLPEVKISVDASCCAGVRPESHAAALQTMQMCQIHVR